MLLLDLKILLKKSSEEIFVHFLMTKQYRQNNPVIVTISAAG